MKIINKTRIVIVQLFVALAPWLIGREELFDYILWYGYDWNILFVALAFINIVVFWLFDVNDFENKKTLVLLFVSLLCVFQIAFLPLIFPIQHPPKKIVRIKGSNTLGSEFMQRLVIEYAIQKNATLFKITYMPKSRQTNILVEFENGFKGDHKISEILFEIEAQGSNSAFSDIAERSLKSGSPSMHANMWMASSPIEKSPKYKDYHTKINIHRIGSDGITIVSNIHQEIKKGLSIDQIRDIFNGDIKLWSEVNSKGEGEEIEVCLRRYSGTTYELERYIGLEKFYLDNVSKSKLNLVECNSNKSMLKCVSEKENRFGYLPFLMAKQKRKIRIIGIRKSNDNILTPDLYSIINTTYPFSRELYLYTFISSNIYFGERIAKDLVSFSKTLEGQAILEDSGLISLEFPPPQKQTQPIGKQTVTLPPLPTYREERSVLEVLFKSGNNRLSTDNKQKIDNWKNSICKEAKKYAVYGFTDDIGSSIYNEGLSYLRANSVVKFLNSNKQECKYEIYPPIPMGEKKQRTDPDKSRRVEIHALKNELF